MYWRDSCRLGKVIAERSLMRRVANQRPDINNNNICIQINFYEIYIYVHVTQIKC